MNKRILILILTFLVQGSVVIGQYATGCLKEQRDPNLAIKREIPKNLDNLPSSYSLLKWAPPVMSQGSLPSCTAWSGAYAGLTIVKRIEANSKSVKPYSPLSLYNRLKAKYDEDPCNAGGCYVSEALTMLEDYGCPKFSDKPNACGYANATTYFNDKLYRYDEISETEYNIKSALVQNAPVVFAIQYYTHGWGQSKYLSSDGVWSGYYNGPDGYHAMTFIGYDDRKGEDGAFLVMNSWGDDWGNDGFFWLQYKDLIHVDGAYMMVPNPSSTNNNDVVEDDHYYDDNDYNDHWNSGTNQVFRLYNECNVTTYLALAQQQNGQWVSRGWYAAQPGSYVDVNIGDREADQIYWMASNEAEKVHWFDPYNGSEFCYDPTDAFTIYENSNPSCPKSLRFFEESPGFSTSIFSQTIVCQGLDGDVNNRSMTIRDEKVDPREMKDANLNWEEGYLLFDLYSGKIIHPDDQGFFSIWHVNPNTKEIGQDNFPPGRLSEMKMYKFATKRNAELWLQTTD